MRLALVGEVGARKGCHSLLFFLARFSGSVTMSVRAWAEPAAVLSFRKFGGEGGAFWISRQPDSTRVRRVDRQAAGVTHVRTRPHGPRDSSHGANDRAQPALIISAIRYSVWREIGSAVHWYGFPVPPDPCTTLFRCILCHLLTTICFFRMASFALGLVPDRLTQTRKGAAWANGSSHCVIWPEKSLSPQVPPLEQKKCEFYE